MLGLGLSLAKAGTIPRFLLDQISGAVAGYSTRKLKAAFISDVVEVRRSGDNAESGFTATEITNGTLASWVTAGGGTEHGYVTTWYDQSGEGNNATQGTANIQPQIVDGGSVITENGKPAISFDGWDELYTSGYIVELSQNDASIFAVIKGGGSGYILVESDNDSPYSSNFILGSSGGGGIIWVDGDNYGSFGANQCLLGADVISGEIQAYLNGSTNGASGYSSINAEVGNTTGIGGHPDDGGNYSGKIQEIITFKSNQSANRTEIDDNINDYYEVY